MSRIVAGVVISREHTNLTNLMLQRNQKKTLFIDMNLIQHPIKGGYCSISLQQTRQTPAHPFLLLVIYKARFKIRIDRIRFTQ